MTSVAVIDYGMGNLRSVAKALEHAHDGSVVHVTSDPDVVHKVDRIVFPGQGAIGTAMAERFPSRGAGDGPLENSVAEIAAAAQEARTAYYTEHAGTVLSRLERLADLLASVEGYEPMAAIYYRTIVERYGHLEGDDSFGRRVKRAREQFHALSGKHATAIPDRPR